MGKARISGYTRRFFHSSLCVSQLGKAPGTFRLHAFSGFRPVLREIRLELNQVRHFISVALVKVQVAGGYSSKGGGRGLNKEAGGVQSSSFSLAVPAGVLLSIAGLPD